ncbi:MAG TPA: hypothetical protein VNJ53_07300 [Gaiellaceae bacterium]|nr:hypothetical protein [Gaiellaceae bacterium]
MDEAAPRARTRLELGALATLAALALAALVGVLAVADAGHEVSGLGVGVGVAAATFLSGAAFAVALACLARGRAEALALATIAATGVALDLLVLAVLLDLDDEAYGKLVGVAFTWSFFGLLVLGLALALPAPRGLAQTLYVAAVVAALAAGLVTTWLVATAGSEDGVVTESGLVPVDALGSEGLLRPLGVALVLLAALWFGALAADRRERALTR